MCIPLTRGAINTPFWSSVCSYQFKYMLFFYPHTQRGRIKSWVRGGSGVWPAITYAPVIWLYWLWAACYATLLGRGNIKLIIAIDGQSICQCVELGGWADAVFASFPLPSLRHLCSQQPAGLAPGNHWGRCVDFSTYSIYIHGKCSIHSGQITFSWQTGSQMLKKLEIICKKYI